MSSESDDGESGHFGTAYNLKTADETLDHYRSWAQSYDREVGEENRYAQPKRVAQALLSHGFDTNGLILDAGCGSGLSGETLHAIGCKTITGCDFSPDMLQIAASKNIYKNLFEADLNKPLDTIETGSFDAVTAVGVFSFAHIEPQACQELLRVLKPNGLFVIALNAPFWEKGDLRQTLDDLEQRDTIQTLSREFGDHLPGHDVMGWVVTMRKR